MNARIYDPEIGRFLSPDTIVQDPYDGQAFNRYSYVRNNPLTLIDPTGHSWLSKKWKKYKGKIIGAVVTAFTGGLGTFAAGALGGAAGAAITGGNIWKGALTGGISAQAFKWAGHGTNVETTFSKGTLFKRHVGFGAVSGGINSVIMGGKFGEGFKQGGLSAGLAKAMTLNGRFNHVRKGDFHLGQFGATLAGGGIGSRLSGGSFSDGVGTAVSGYMNNALASLTVTTIGVIGGTARAMADHKRWINADSFGEGVLEFGKSFVAGAGGALAGVAVWGATSVGLTPVGGGILAGNAADFTARGIDAMFGRGLQMPTLGEVAINSVIGGSIGGVGGLAGDLIKTGDPFARVFGGAAAGTSQFFSEPAILGAGLKKLFRVD